MVVGSEPLEAPRLSVAFAVNVYSPATTLDQVNTKGPMGFATGTFVVTPRLIVPAKNSTVATSSSTSSACAINVILAGAANFAPFTGLTILTCGGKFVNKPLSAMFTT